MAAAERAEEHQLLALHNGICTWVIPGAPQVTKSSGTFQISFHFNYGPAEFCL
jgi:hypothetical protein